MFNLIKAKYKERVRESLNRSKQLEWSAKQYDNATTIIDQVMESEDNIVVDNDAKNGWYLHGAIGSSFTPEQHTTMLQQAYKLYHENTYARAIIRNLVKFVLGKGPRIIPVDDDNKTKLLDIWKDFKKKNKFNLREKEICTRLFRDGEVFLRFYIDASEGDVKVRFIRSSRIKKPDDKEYNDNYSYGIQTNPDDIEDVINYILCDDEGHYKKMIEADEVIHLKIFCDSDQKRGISLLRIGAKRLRQYEEWLNDRVVLNKVRSAIALVRTVSGSAKNVKSIRDENLANRHILGNRVKLPRAGTMITSSKGIEYNMLSPNIQAADVKDDGRNMLLSVAAGVGFPEMIFTADYSNANYASSLTAMNPFIREIEDWQDYFESFYKELFDKVMQAKKDVGKLAENVDTECEIEFPPIIQADLDKLTKAYEILYKYRVVSRKTWRHKMDLDDDTEKANIETEDGEDGGTFGNIPGMNPNNTPVMNPNTGQPANPTTGGKINMPMSPVNQYGQQLIQAMKDKDWQNVNELSAKIIEFEKSDNG